MEDLERIKEKGVFIVDDVAFVQAKHGFEIGEAIVRKGIKKCYYLETRGDVLLRNKDVFKFWKKLGLKYIFVGLEAIDEEGLRKYRKRANYHFLNFIRNSLKTQQILNKKHRGWAGIASAGKIALGNLLHGQTNFIKMLWKFNSIYNANSRIADHQQPVKYKMALPPSSNKKMNHNTLYIHEPRRRSGRAIDDSTEKFIEETRMGNDS